MPKLRDTETAARQARLHDLQAEQAGLEAAMTAARQAADADGWMRLLNRQAEMPGEIAGAHAALLPALLADAWAAVDAAVAVEEQARAEEPELTAAVEALEINKVLPLGRGQAGWMRDPVAVAEVQGRMATARKAQDRGWQAIQDAVAEVRLALAVVDDLEAQMVAAGLEVPDGEGLRAAPRPMGNRTISISPHGDTAPAARLLALIQSTTGDGAATRLPLRPGSIPPRWAAYGITNPRAFAPSEGVSA